MAARYADEIHRVASRVAEETTQPHIGALMQTITVYADEMRDALIACEVAPVSRWQRLRWWLRRVGR